MNSLGNECTARSPAVARIPAVRPGVRAQLVAAADRLLEWIDRARARRQLARLDDRMLHDIGIARLDADREARKPFWRP